MHFGEWRMPSRKWAGTGHQPALQTDLLKAPGSTRSLQGHGHRLQERVNIERVRAGMGLHWQRRKGRDHSR